MPIEIDLPKEIELIMEKHKELRVLIKWKIESEFVKEVKEGVFLSLLFDTLLENSDLSEEDIQKLDKKIKRNIREKLGWKSVI